ncbi:unnamed protein product [Linum tenue]|nr:unnamed protein product [Linum tenue]CAI0458617.1 unnamed protein product [Linum tenue]
MARDSCMIAELVVKEGRSAFEGVGSLVDVAGGTGNMAKAVAKAFPGMSCTVLDLPHVVSGLEDGGNNVKYVAGDMFESIPAADAVLLKVISCFLFYLIFYNLNIIFNYICNCKLIALV